MLRGVGYSHPYYNGVHKVNTVPFFYSVSRGDSVRKYDLRHVLSGFAWIINGDIYFSCGALCPCEQLSFGELCTMCQWGGLVVCGALLCLILWNATPMRAVIV